MSKQFYAQVAAAVLATTALCGAAVAQTSPGVRSDMAPLPAEERESLGAVVFPEQPVLAQRPLAPQARIAEPDTRALGAGPANPLNLTREEQERLKASEAADRRKWQEPVRIPR